MVGSLARTQLLSRLLDLHLTRTITRLREQEEQNDMSSKFTALADRMARTKRSWDARADDLAARLDKLDVRGDEAFRQHERLAEAAEAGFRDLEEAARSLEGGNNPPADEEGSPASGGASFPSSSVGD